TAVARTPNPGPDAGRCGGVPQGPPCGCPHQRMGRQPE
ncbi:carbohydrate-binding protein, partial [Streptomyces sp. TUS-ST3]